MILTGCNSADCFNVTSNKQCRFLDRFNNLNSNKKKRFVCHYKWNNKMYNFVMLHNRYCNYLLIHSLSLLLLVKYKSTPILVLYFFHVFNVHFFMYLSLYLCSNYFCIDGIFFYYYLSGHEMSFDLQMNFFFSCYIFKWHFDMHNIKAITYLS